MGTDWGLRLWLPHNGRMSFQAENGPKMPYTYQEPKGLGVGAEGWYIWLEVREMEVIAA